MRAADLLVAALGAVCAAALLAQRPAAHTIAVGQTVRGTLRKRDVLLARDSTYAQEWRIDATEGEVVTVDLASDSLDAFLILFGPGLTSDLQDDDSGGNCNARLTLRFPKSGAYHIVVTTAEKRQAGPYTLSVASGAKPKSLVRCRRDR